jgi:hypothetical protein
MPLWVSLYFAGYITFSLWAHVDDFRKGKVNSWVIYEIIGNVCLLLSALMHWYPQLYPIFGKATVIFFVLGLVSVIVFAYRGFKKNYPDPELSLSANIGLSLFSTILFISITSPLIWWGAQSINNHL